MRINAPVPIVVPRYATEDTVLSGVFIPKDAFINVDIYSIQRSKTYWKDPDTFNPDRFAEDGEKSMSERGMTFLPFGGGPRTCIGQNMSYNEERVMLSMLRKCLLD